MPHLERNPADERERDQRALELVFVGAAASYFVAIQGISLARIRQAIRSGNPAPILDDPAWATASPAAREAVAAIYNRLARFGGKTAIEEIPESLLRPSVRVGQRELPPLRDLPALRELPPLSSPAGAVEPGLTERILASIASAASDSGVPVVDQLAVIADVVSQTDAILLIQNVDDRTREGIRAMVRRAARQFRENASPQVLRRLAAAIQSQIGLTNRQASMIERIRDRLLLEGIAPAVVDKQIANKIARQIELRAKQIADRGVIEIISRTRHAAWQAAIESGELPEDVQKQWQDQGDSRVRPNHARQTDMGPIPFAEPYPVFGVDHPPAPDHGCRCWEVLILPD